jgi:hypothetical protein
MVKMPDPEPSNAAESLLAGWSSGTISNEKGCPRNGRSFLLGKKSDPGTRYSIIEYSNIKYRISLTSMVFSRKLDKRVMSCWGRCLPRSISAEPGPRLFGRGRTLPQSDIIPFLRKPWRYKRPLLTKMLRSL